MIYFTQIKNTIFLQVSGKDAPRYLNARLTNNISLLKEDLSIKAAQLTPQGRTEGLFQIIKNSDKYLLYCDGGDKEGVLTAFKRYIVADRVVVEDLSSQLSLFHFFADSSEGLSKEIKEIYSKKIPEHAQSRLNTFLNSLNQEHYTVFQLEEHTLINRKRFNRYGLDLISSNQDLAQEFAGVFNYIELEQLAAKRIQYSQPSYPNELNERRVFLEGGLSDAISFKKGCYVGQEVMEKIDSYGSTPAEIIKISTKIEKDDFNQKQASGELKKVYLPNNEECGEVLTIAYDDQENQLWAFVRLRERAMEENDGVCLGGIRCIVRNIS